MFWLALAGAAVMPVVVWFGFVPTVVRRSFREEGLSPADRRAWLRVALGAGVALVVAIKLNRVNLANTQALLTDRFDYAVLLLAMVVALLVVLLVASAIRGQLAQRLGGIAKGPLVAIASAVAATILMVRTNADGFGWEDKVDYEGFWLWVGIKWVLANLLEIVEVVVTVGSFVAGILAAIHWKFRAAEAHPMLPQLITILLSWYGVFVAVATGNHGLSPLLDLLAGGSALALTGFNAYDIHQLREEGVQLGYVPTGHLQNEQFQG